MTYRYVTRLPRRGTDDFEVLDLTRHVSRQVMCVAGREDAETIADVLNDGAGYERAPSHVPISRKVQTAIGEDLDRAAARYGIRRASPVQTDEALRSVVEGHVRRRGAAVDYEEDDGAC